PRRFWLTVSGTLLFQGTVVGMIHLFLRANRLGWGEAFGFNRPHRFWTGLIAVAAALLVFPMNLSLMWVSQRAMEWQAIEPVVQPTVEVVRAATDWRQQWLIGVMVVLTGPVFEELLFRGILYPALKQTGFPRLALWGTALIFAATHANLMTFLPLAFFGVVLALLYEYTDNLMAPIVTHALFNGANFAWLVLEGGPMA
ncbi:MAG: CPBP family intramembrane metalloprotease, partial [Verrucomicrobia bacterium]|nr:CPBP family intramembrane metalloprotease [Verrucomicrobiota bacterium]